MKKNTYSIKGPKGVTLIELTVVIAILLVLISVLFIGAQYYKDNADQAACVVNQSTAQKAFRAAENLTPSSGTKPTSLDEVVNAGAMAAVPTCPATGASYALSGGDPNVVECQDGTVGTAHNTAAGSKAAW